MNRFSFFVEEHCCCCNKKIKEEIEPECVPKNEPEGGKEGKREERKCRGRLFKVRKKMQNITCGAYHSKRNWKATRICPKKKSRVIYVTLKMTII